MFLPHEMWRHRDCKDLDILVLKLQYNGPLYVKVHIMYWNRHYKCFCSPEAETVKIYREDFHKWNVIKNG